GRPMAGWGSQTNTPPAGAETVGPPPIDADAGEDGHEDPCIEHAGIEPVPRPARVQPRPWKETRKHAHQARPVTTYEVVPGPVGRVQSNFAEGKGLNVVTMPQRSPRAPPRASVQRMIGCGFPAPHQRAGAA